MAEVLTGFWNDYDDKSPIFRTTLTVTVTQANYIISAFSFFVASLILPSLWQSLIACIYLFRCTRPANQNYELKQRRVILRNAKLPGDAFMDLLKSFCSWRRRVESSEGGPFQFLRLLALALGGMAVMTAGSISIPPLMASDVTDNVIVLAKSGSCGFLRVFDAEADLDEVAASTSREFDETIDARRYATEFYGDGSYANQTLSEFPVPSLPFEVDNAATCPFSEELCLLGSDGSISFDTGLLDSHKHLGINARAQDRIQYRWKTTCTPLKLNDEHVKQLSPGSERDGLEVPEDAPLFDIWLGPQERNEYTFSYQFNPLSRLGYQVK